MKTRNGKIAQLPKSIRDDLNHRLENGKQGRDLLEWLNGLPQTKELIAQKFDNQPITASNLSDWRYGGFQDWRADQLRQARIQRICETGGNLEKAETGDLFENFARMAIAEMLTDLDAAQKLRGEKRDQKMHHLVRDLSRLQNAYNRSRWSALAWTKYNDSGTGVSPVRPSELETQTPKPELPTPTPSAPTSLVPDRAESQAVPPDEGEPKPNGNGMYVLHFTNCNCGDPCPKCHAPDSDYPLEDAIRDHRYYRKHGRNPCDRHGKSKFLINVACDCACDRCAEKTNGRAALPRCPILLHAEAREETPTAETKPTLQISPQPIASPLSPLSPSRPFDPHSDFLRKMSHLKSIAQ